MIVIAIFFARFFQLIGVF